MYLADKKPYLTNVSFDDMICFEHVAGVGNCYFFGCDPVDKCRVLVPFATPIQFNKLDPNNKTCNDKFRALYFGAAEMMGLDDAIDPACADPVHLFYDAACPNNMKAHAHTLAVEGLLLDPATILPSTREPKKVEARKSGPHTTRADKSHLVGGLNLKAWLAQYAATFDIEKLMEERGLVRRAAR